MNSRELTDKTIERLDGNVPFIHTNDGGLGILLEPILKTALEVLAEENYLELIPIPDGRGICSVCHLPQVIRKDGNLRAHGGGMTGPRCPGTNRPPL